MKKDRYTRPVTEEVTIATYCSILAGSQDNWADAKHNDTGAVEWDDEEEYDDNNGNVNWAGYQKDMSIW